MTQILKFDFDKDAIASLPESLREISKTIEAITQNITIKIDVDKSEFISKSDSFVSNIASIITIIGEISSSFAFFKKIMEKSKKDNEQDNKDILKDTENTFAKLKDKYKDFSENTSTKLKEGLEKLKDGLGEFKENICEIGTTIATNLLKGIKEGLGNYSEIISEAHVVTSNLTKTFQEDFDEHSPSKVFQEIGEYLIKGLSIGISEHSEEAVTAISDVAEDVITAGEGFSDAAQYGDELGQSLSSVTEGAENLRSASEGMLGVAEEELSSASTSADTLSTIKN